MQTNIYTLPELSMVGGSTLEFCLQMVNERGESISLINTNIDFAVCEFSNKTGTPLFNLTPVTELDDLGVTSVVRVTIPPAKTTHLVGKYIYQVTISDLDNKVAIPNHGIINIFRNINADFLG